ncbi:hypothetical protein HYPSUDRAFT_201799 [Hypholoma sublateritium FD-334 SS-4]|uniref:Uncharacterized protein n=1 Tax=Hypholoma sublateritium (strain FD-334 SS-4) TaxID=945553 RepID=A0A0D2L7B1_HYPSF|nr:hypothetical protein HYPSUDRAFT_201799 [Hypholoma sublateritium FD-334 SS-4]
MASPAMGVNHEFREIFEVEATEKFAQYKLAVSADPHSTGTDPRPHWTVRLYNALDVHVATMHIDRLWAHSIEKTTMYYDFYEKLVEENGSEALATTKLCFCRGEVIDVETNGSKAGVDPKECWVASNGSTVKSDVYRVKSDVRADSVLQTKGARVTAAAWVERSGPLEEHVGAGWCRYQWPCRWSWGNSVRLRGDGVKGGDAVLRKAVVYMWMTWTLVTKPPAQSRVAREIKRAKMARDKLRRKEEEQLSGEKTERNKR